MTWTQLTCEGLAPLFKARPCENYSSPPPRCSLLRERAIARLSQTGRCVFAMVGFVQEKLAARFDHLDDREDINLRLLIDSLGRVIWNDTSNPAAWLAYVKKAVHNATVRALARQRLMPEEKNCGTCAHLPKSNPRVCQISGDAKRSFDEACSDYQFLTITIAAGSENHSDELDEDAGAKFVPEASERSERAQQSVDGRMDLESLRVALVERVEQERLGTLRRAITARQYELFVNLCQLTEEDYPDKDGLKIVAERMDLSLRMVRRDLAEIRHFLSTRFAGQGD